MNSSYRFLTNALPILAFIVITVGAYVRLTDAGLGCPDWPGCYGQLVISQDHSELAAAAREFQQEAVEVGKAWREMFHRYIAAGLGLGIVALFAFSIKERPKPRQTKLLASLVLLVIFQGMLGMWTVTLLLKPLVVTGHLLGGLATLSLLWWHFLREKYHDVEKSVPTPLINGVLVVLVGQIFLGGWTSTNYAALACTDFPTCHGAFWPEMDITEAFVLWRGLGVDYEFGVLDTPARTAIHFFHRVWAIVTAACLTGVAIYAIRIGSKPAKRAGWCIIFALGVQLSLGISNVIFGLPLPIAVAHNGGAAVLLLAVVTLKYFNNYKVR